jgi:hypothetical protein
MQASPLTDRHWVLRADRLEISAAPHAVLVSLQAEPRVLWRHRRLGYHLCMFPHRVSDAGPAIRNWLREAFEPAPRTVDDIRADYVALVDLIRDAERGRPDAGLLILNAMSSDGYEDIQSYAGLDAPPGQLLGKVAVKQANLMLHDLARERDISIVDVDHIAAGLGGQRHLPDGVHQSGLMQAETRAEILRILRYRRVPGFEPSGFS